MFGIRSLVRATSFSSNVRPGTSKNLQDLANENPEFSKAIQMLTSNDIAGAIEIAMNEYKKEFDGQNMAAVFVSGSTVSDEGRPAFSFLSSMLASLGPRHPETASAIAMLRTITQEATPFKPRRVEKRHGGYPVRLNNGKWTWQGPHWSRGNNRTWKTGYSSDFTYGWGK